jgi:hypothetical protein
VVEFNVIDVAKFEVIDLAKLNLSSLVGATTAYIFVDVQSRLPVAIEGIGVRGEFSRISDIEVNRVATSIFETYPRCLKMLKPRKNGRCGYLKPS